MICKDPLSREILPKESGHFFDAVQVHVVSAVIGICLPVDPHLIGVLVHVDILNAFLPREFRDIVDPGPIVISGRSIAVEDQLNALFIADFL